VQVALREGHLDTVLAELGLNLPQVGGLYGPGPFYRFRGESYDEFEVQTAVAELDEPHLGVTPLDLVQGPGHLVSGFQYCLAQQLLLRSPAARTSSLLSAE